MTKCSNCNFICDKNMCLCPSCRTSLNTDSSIRVAQYGGVGGGNPPSWQPGSSPNAHGMTGGGGSNGGFSSVVDAGLDAIMGRTRHDVDDDNMGESNFEARLHQFHKYREDDAKPYLPFKERQKIKEYENLQRRNKFTQDTERAVYENSPAYVKEYFGPKLEHMIPTEMQLNDVRKNDNDRTKAIDDQVVTINPDGKEKVASTRKSDRIRHTTTTVFGPHDEEEESTDTIGKRQFNTFPMGNSGEMMAGFSSGEVDNYLKGSGLDELNGFLDEPTLSYDYPEADEVDILGERGTDKLPSPLANADLSNTNMEKQLRSLKTQQTPSGMPSDPYEEHNLDKKRGQEGRGTAYPSKDLQLGYTGPTPYI